MQHSGATETYEGREKTCSIPFSPYRPVAPAGPIRRRRGLWSRGFTARLKFWCNLMRFLATQTEPMVLSKKVGAYGGPSLRGGAGRRRSFAIARRGGFVVGVTFVDQRAQVQRAGRWRTRRNQGGGDELTQKTKIGAFARESRGRRLRSRAGRGALGLRLRHWAYRMMCAGRTGISQRQHCSASREPSPRPWSGQSSGRPPVPRQRPHA